MTRSHPSDNANLFQFMPSDQMEADSRMFYTLLRHNNIYIRKVNSISICIAVKLAFTSLRLTEFWVSFRLWQKVSDNLYPCNRKNNLVPKGASHSHSSLLAAIGLQVHLI